MLRRLFALCVGLCLFASAGAEPVQAQKVFVLLTTDVSPAAKWGVYEPNLSMDAVRMWGFFVSNTPKESLVLESLQIENDADATPERILTALRRLTPGPQDAIVFYFTGHGGIDDRGSYFELAGGKLYRQEIRALFANKKARLAVLITDCCNSRSDERRQMAAAPFFDPPRTYTPLFTSLFVRPKGIVDINSSAPGQSAFFLENPDGDPEKFGSIFTTALADWAQRNSKRSATWDDLVRDVSLKVHATFRQSYPKGAAMVKGGAPQADQDVFALEYPGMSPGQGLRAGIYVVDDEGRVRITRIDAESPAAGTYEIATGNYVSLPIGSFIAAVNGHDIKETTGFQTAVKESPQIMRLKIVRGERSGDYLVRLRY